MIRVDLLKNHPQSIPMLANIWREVLGKNWMPEIGIEEIESLYYEELKSDMPMTYIALNGEIPVGSCTLELNGGIRPDLRPWIGDLVVEPKYQKQGIGKMLVDVSNSQYGDHKMLYQIVFSNEVKQSRSMCMKSVDLDCFANAKTRQAWWLINDLHIESSFKRWIDVNTFENWETGPLYYLYPPKSSG